MHSHITVGAHSHSTSASAGVIGVRVGAIRELPLLFSENCNVFAELFAQG